MKSLVFEGRIIKGRGIYSGLEIPGRSELQARSINVPRNWPDALFPGSLNIHVTHWPDGFLPPNNSRNGAFGLDGEVLAPAFTIPGGELGNNMLIWDERTQRAREAPLDVPGIRCPARVWRAELYIPDRELKVACWLLRRRGSRAGGGWELELVSHEGIRATYGLPDSEEYPAYVTLYERSKPSTHHLRSVPRQEP